MTPSLSKPKVPLQHVFNKPSADVVLRSSDKIDFHVHKLVLSDASPVFEAMFALPQGPPPSDASANSEEASKPSLPVVPMQDSAATLHLLLGVLYPGKGAPLNNTSQIGDVLAVADKYAMDGVTAQLQQILESSDFIACGPFSILATYAIARRHNLIRLSANAAQAALKYSLPPYSLTGLNTMTTQHYEDLRRFRAICVSLIDRWMPDDDCDDDDWDDAIREVWCPESDYRFKSNNRGPSQITLLNLDRCDCRGRLWFRLHLHRLKEAFSRSVCGESLQEPKLLDQTIASIGSCGSCLAKAPMELMEFNKRLGERLDSEMMDMDFWSYVT